MLGLSSANTSLSNHVGSFEFAGWQEMNDSVLESASVMSIPQFSRPYSCANGPNDYDDSALEQAAEISASPSYQPITMKCFAPAKINDGSLEQAADLVAAPGFTIFPSCR